MRSHLLSNKSRQRIGETQKLYYSCTVLAKGIVAMFKSLIGAKMPIQISKRKNN